MTYEDVIDYVYESFDWDSYDTFDELMQSVDAYWIENNRPIPPSEFLPESYLDSMYWTFEAERNV
jgi:hypothetical protein